LWKAYAGRLHKNLIWKKFKYQMKNNIVYKLLFSAGLISCIFTYACTATCQAGGITTSYKQYSIFRYKNQNFLCEPYVVHKDDWLYKIFRAKGEISEKDFPYFLKIFKRINPEISNIDAIEPGNHILIPLKKIKKEDYNQTKSGKIDVSVVEFSALPRDIDLKPYIKKHLVKKGENVSSLMDKSFLKKNGQLSEEGIKAFRLANPNIKDINIVYEGRDIYLPDPSIRSASWFQAFMGKKTALSGRPDGQTPLPYKAKALTSHQLLQLKRYAALIGGTLLSRGEMVFPGENNSTRILNLSSNPLIETSSGEKILILPGENRNQELLKSIRTYWKNLKVQSVSKTLASLKKTESRPQPSANITACRKKMIRAIFSDTDYEYIPEAKIPFTINNIVLEAAFGRIVRENRPDILLNFGNVYGAALDILKKREFEIIDINPGLGPVQIIKKIFSHLGYDTWADPSFYTGKNIEILHGLYAVKLDDKDKLFIALAKPTPDARIYLNNENIKILRADSYDCVKP